MMLTGFILFKRKILFSVKGEMADGLFVASVKIQILKKKKNKGIRIQRPDVGWTVWEAYDPESYLIRKYMK